MDRERDVILRLWRGRAGDLKTGQQVSAWSALIALFLLVVGGCFLVVGFHDATLRDVPQSVTGVGTLLTLTGLAVAIAGAVQLWLALSDAKVATWSGRLVLAACILVAIDAAYFVIAGARAVETNWHLMAIGVIVVVAATGSFIAFQQASGVTLGKVGTTVLSVLGVGFGVFQFWYAQEYLPTHAPTALDLSTTLESAGSRGGLDLYTATITVKNTGSGKVIAFTGTYVVSGIGLKQLPEGALTEQRITKPLASPGTDPYNARFSRHAVETGFAPLAGGKLFADNDYLEPGKELSREYVIAVPACSYDVLALRANAIAARGELLRLEREPTRAHTFFERPVKLGKATVDQAGFYAEWHVQDLSWVHDIVDGKERWLMIVWEHESAGSQRGYFIPAVWLRTRTNMPPQQVTALTRAVGSGLGLATTFSDYELPVVDKDGSACPAGK